MKTSIEDSVKGVTRKTKNSRNKTTNKPKGVTKKQNDLIESLSNLDKKTANTIRKLLDKIINPNDKEKHGYGSKNKKEKTFKKSTHKLLSDSEYYTADYNQKYLSKEEKQQLKREKLAKSYEDKLEKLINDGLKNGGVIQDKKSGKNTIVDSDVQKELLAMNRAFVEEATKNERSDMRNFFASTIKLGSNFISGQQNTIRTLIGPLNGIIAPFEKLFGGNVFNAIGSIITKSGNFFKKIPSKKKPKIQDVLKIGAMGSGFAYLGNMIEENQELIEESEQGIFSSLFGKLKKGALVGALLKTAYDAVEGYMKSEDWGTSKWAGTIGGALAGTGEGWTNAGVNSLKGLGIGMQFGPIGACIGAIGGAVLGYFGGEKVSTFIDDVGEWITDKIEDATKDTISKKIDKNKNKYKWSAEETAYRGSFGGNIGQETLANNEVLENEFYEYALHENVIEAMNNGGLKKYGGKNINAEELENLGWSAFDEQSRKFAKERMVNSINGFSNPYGSTIENCFDVNSFTKEWNDKFNYDLYLSALQGYLPFLNKGYRGGTSLSDPKFAYAILRDFANLLENVNKNPIKYKESKNDYLNFEYLMYEDILSRGKLDSIFSAKDMFESIFEKTKKSGFDYKNSMHLIRTELIDYDAFKDTWFSNKSYENVDDGIFSIKTTPISDVKTTLTSLTSFSDIRESSKKELEKILNNIHTNDSDSSGKWKKLIDLIKKLSEKKFVDIRHAPLQRIDVENIINRRL